VYINNEISIDLYICEHDEGCLLLRGILLSAKLSKVMMDVS